MEIQLKFKKDIFIKDILKVLIGFAIISFLILSYYLIHAFYSQVENFFIEYNLILPSDVLVFEHTFKTVEYKAFILLSYIIISLMIFTFVFYCFFKFMIPLIFVTIQSFKNSIQKHYYYRVYNEKELKIFLLSRLYCFKDSIAIQKTLLSEIILKHEDLIKRNGFSFTLEDLIEFGKEEKYLKVYIEGNQSSNVKKIEVTENLLQEALKFPDFLKDIDKGVNHVKNNFN